MANLPLESFFSSSCCENEMELCDMEPNNPQEEKKGCCEDGSCECQCCNSNTFYSPEEIAYTKLPVVFIESTFNFEFQYSIDSYTSLFRPPLT